jgi:hypothetical protein
MDYRSEFDTPEAREPPDYKVATVALWLSRCSDIARKARVDFETFERIRMLADEIYEAISTRGARVGEIVEAIRDVRPRGSILADLPTMRARPPMPKREPSE